MEEFFKQLLDDLKEINGSDQLRWLKKECVENARTEEEALAKYARKKKVLISSMIIAAKEYHYIPEEDQKEIILESCSKDQDCNDLHSKMIHKWLLLHKNRYLASVPEPEPFKRIVHTPEQSAKIDKILEGYLKDLSESVKVPTFRDLKQDMKNIEREDRVRVEGEKSVKKKFVGLTLFTPAEQIEISKRKMEFNKKVGLDKVDEFRLLHSYRFKHIKAPDGVVVIARNEEEAEALFLEVYEL